MANSETLLLRQLVAQ
ncbi:hypothetical protein YPPY113_0258, partial [Yersinia pestis PY-113]